MRLVTEKGRSRLSGQGMAASAAMSLGVVYGIQSKAQINLSWASPTTNHVSRENAVVVQRKNIKH